MRFVSNGPSIPADLLIARDSGDVLFFCGAGVSRAQAKLPDFTTLAENVLNLLGAALNSPARGLFDAGRRFEEASGLSGLIATDRIFGMLEREFEPSEVRDAVAFALKPQSGYGLDAHRALLDLSRSRTGAPRLVTTNFDLLFEECEEGLESSSPPKLPDPRREIDFRGIIHLHGRVNADYSSACNDELVLSSADFGHAYLADGWATRYIQELLKRFKIVFVGYSADDPPVQYLLEALNRYEKPTNKLYAFQSGNAKSAMTQWAHKGVEPIPYDSANGHTALWETLSAWADRARDLNAWRDRLIKSAVKGPADMRPHERGMIADLVSTTSGARILATSENTLPAEWLFVLDCNSRYAHPERTNRFDEASTYFDPFEVYGLDDDELPAPTDPDQLYSRRTVPKNAWDGINSIPTDLASQAATQFRNWHQDATASLPQRISALSSWFVKVAHQPEALWWSAKQGSLHPYIQQQIEFSMQRHKSIFTPVVRKGWRFLLDSWQHKYESLDTKQHSIQVKAERDGWSNSLVREAVALYQPILTVEARSGVRAPTDHPAIILEEILQIDVKYARPHTRLELPLDFLGYAVVLFRQQLEHAVQLELEVNGNDRLHFDTTRETDDNILDEDGYGLTGHLVIFTKMLLQLAEVDNRAAHKEVNRWSDTHDPLFTRLQIWAAGRSELTPPAKAAKIFKTLKDEAFWSSIQERDLLYSLRDRWAEMTQSSTKGIEKRLLRGPLHLLVATETNSDLVAYYKLSYISWLSDQGVIFSFDLNPKLEALKLLAPSWTTESYASTAQSNTPKIRNIEVDTSAASLTQLPIGEVLSHAEGLRQYNIRSGSYLEPFRGLANQYPVRALRVLSEANRRGMFAPWAWSIFLSSVNSSHPSTRLISTIGRRIAALDAKHLEEIAYPVAEWLNDHSGCLFAELPDVFELVWESTIKALATKPVVKPYPRANRSWVDEGLNSPVGLLTTTLFKNPATAQFKSDSGLPNTWRKLLESVLGLPGDYRQYAIAMISRHLNWLFNIDPEWVESNLLALLGAAEIDIDAFWAGYFWGARIPQSSLYIKLKPPLLILASQSGARRNQSMVLAGMLLAGWECSDESRDIRNQISDIEFREVIIHANDELRTLLLLQVQRWASDPESRWGDLLVPFLTRVWPRQRDVRTEVVTTALIQLAFALPERFSEIVDIITPALSSSRQTSWGYHLFIEKKSEIIAERFPSTLLKLLGIILADDSSFWPHGAHDLLLKLADQKEIEADPRLKELLRAMHGR